MGLNGNGAQRKMPEGKFMLMRQGIQMGLNGNSAQRKMPEGKFMLMRQGDTNVVEWYFSTKEHA